MPSESAHHGRSQVAFDMTTHSEDGESAQQQLNSLHHLGASGLLLMDSSQARLSGLSFIPSQIKSFLSRKQPSPNSKHRLATESKLSFGARSLRPQSNEYG